MLFFIWVIIVFGVFFGFSRVFGWLWSGLLCAIGLVAFALFFQKFETLIYWFVGFLVVITLFYWAYCFLHWLLIDLWKKPSNTEQERNKRR